LKKKVKMIENGVMEVIQHIIGKMRINVLIGIRGHNHRRFFPDQCHCLKKINNPD
jgi:hypothetical protein